jgi:hypothetical protein
MNEKLRFINPDLPVVCNLTAVQQAARLTQTGDIFKGCTEMLELEDGYAFRFENNAQWAGRILEFIETERVCCQFFRFEMVFEPQLGPLWLYLRGSKAAKEFIRVNFARQQV